MRFLLWLLATLTILICVTYVLEFHFSLFPHWDAYPSQEERDQAIIRARSLQKVEYND